MWLRNNDNCGNMMSVKSCCRRFFYTISYFHISTPAHWPAGTPQLQHIEFFHTAHFEHRYHRQKATGPLALFIDFFWETNFDALWHLYPEGFSDALFPNIGYTYLINLGTPFVMQLEEESYPVKGDGFLPRNKAMICHHSQGNRIFGIKFKVSPVLFQKKVNFREYRAYIFPLAYLIDRNIIEAVKGATHFNQRVSLISKYYQGIIEQHSGTLQAVSVVTDVLAQCNAENHYAPVIETIALQPPSAPTIILRLKKAGRPSSMPTTTRAAGMVIWFRVRSGAWQPAAKKQY